MHILRYWCWNSGNPSWVKPILLFLQCSPHMSIITQNIVLVSEHSYRLSPDTWRGVLLGFTTLNFAEIWITILFYLSGLLSRQFCNSDNQTLVKINPHLFSIVIKKFKFCLYICVMIVYSNFLILGLAHCGFEPFINRQETRWVAVLLVDGKCTAGFQDRNAAISWKEASNILIIWSNVYNKEDRRTFCFLSGQCEEGNSYACLP